MNLGNFIEAFFLIQWATFEATIRKYKKQHYTQQQIFNNENQMFSEHCFKYIISRLIFSRYYIGLYQQSL